MKHLLILSTSFFLATVGYSQQQVVVDSPEYHQLKVSGQLAGVTVIHPAMPQQQLSPAVYQASTPEKSSTCDCYVEPDGSYIQAIAPNDDGSSDVITLPFTFSFYGEEHDTLYINNNGNVTFDEPMSTYSADAFPSEGAKIISPFWGDVDTHGPNGDANNPHGKVVYKITAHAIYINWDSVGYYSSHGDKRNTFQLILTDGTDPAVTDGNVAFCYKNMDWTTGDASEGENGFGGVPATAGANKGDDVYFFQIARFDHPGNDFDGSLGNPDGISWLDNKSFTFNLVDSTNVPPIPEGISSCDTFRVCAVGDTADFAINFLSPEMDQTTTVTFDNGGLTNLQVVTNSPGNTAQLVLRVIGNLADIGSYDVSVTATDNGTPVGQRTITFTIVIDTSALSAIQPMITPPGACDTATLSILNGPFDTYLWDDFSTNPTTGLGQAGNVGVTVSLGGCYKRVERYINIMEPFQVKLNGDFVICADDTTAQVTIPNAPYYSSVSWGLPDAHKDTLFSNLLEEGTYTIHLVDSAGYCSKDTTFTIQHIDAPRIFGDTTACQLALVTSGNYSYAGGTWAVADTAVHFGPSNTAQDPLIWTSTPGTYAISYTDNACHITLTSNVFYPPFAYTDALDSVMCIGTVYMAYAQQNATVDHFVWSTGITGPQSAIPAPGTYWVTGSNVCHSYTDTIHIDGIICHINAPNIIVLSSQAGNNLFFVDADGIKEFSCRILNRWGNTIYDFNDVHGAWDGRNKSGTTVEEGTYFYEIEATYYSGQKTQKQGFVQVKY